MNQTVLSQATERRAGRLARAVRVVKRDRHLLLLVAPTVVFFLIFSYMPMIGNFMAFQDFRPGAGLFDSPWVGFRWFKEFFSSVYFGRNIANTLILSVSLLAFSFPAPILFALLLNEVRCKPYKSFIQTVSYMPYFVSLVVVVGIVMNFLSVNDGVVNLLLGRLGIESIDFMSSSEWFRPVYIVTDIWQTCGWSSIIYLAAISSLDPQMYEAAYIDGAGRWKQLFFITLPSLAPTIIMLLIIRVGGLMSVGFEKIVLMYKPVIYDVSDVIQTYVYRRGLIDMKYSFATAVGLFNSVINFVLILSVNKISKKLTEVGLW